MMEISLKLMGFAKETGAGSVAMAYLLPGGLGLEN